MTVRRCFAAACLAAVLAVFAASQASAQIRSPRGPQERPARVPEARPDQLEELLEELREDLKLERAQQPLWDSYAEKVRALVLDIARERGRAQEIEKQPPLKRLDHGVDVARDRLTALEDIAAAARALYSRLSPEQQRTADPRLATLVPAVAMGQPPLPERPVQRKRPQ